MCYTLTVAAHAVLARNVRMEQLGSDDIFEFARFRFERRSRCLYRLDKGCSAA
jgi:hypothetical protein